jgi:ABC-type bacteriocin/lantibiotic exporter with double-glycine peptidase domain
MTLNSYTKEAKYRKIPPFKLQPMNIQVKETNDRNNKTTNQRNIVIHKVRGIETIQYLKAEPKIMEYIQSNNIHVAIHNWKEEEWDLKVLGFFTHLQPGKIPI